MKSFRLHIFILILLSLTVAIFYFSNNDKPDYIESTLSKSGEKAVKVIETKTSTKATKYPLHKNITATVFWAGEPKGNGSSEDNSISAWDDEWLKNSVKENPFYLDLPYNDFDDEGERKPDAFKVVPWAKEKNWGSRESMMKNRWVKIIKDGHVCYGQIEDAGPYEYDDYEYVFGSGDVRPKNKLANNAGLDVSPALRDCLKFEGLNDADNRVDWQFVDFEDVPDGPWKKIITTSQINWL